MPMVKLRVVIRDPSGNEDIAGTLVVDGNVNSPLTLPKEFPIEAGQCELQAHCVGRQIQGQNPRTVEVKVPTSPNAPVQKEIFDVS